MGVCRSSVALPDVDGENGVTCENLSIITPCSRPHHLARIRETIPDGAQWIVVLDRPNLDDAPRELLGASEIEFYSTTGAGIDGNPQRNLGLSYARREYVYFLDDDNIVHPALSSVVAAHARDGKVVVVNQLRADGTVRLRARPPVRTGRVDTAQFLVPRDVAVRHRWKVDAKFADGAYFSEIYAQRPEAFAFVDVDAAYYNFLEPEHRRRSDGFRR
jgi:hypothetical protein